jgi:TRAP-type uncharacterized transport system substrate-binding protein
MDRPYSRRPGGFVWLIMAAAVLSWVGLITFRAFPGRHLVIAAGAPGSDYMQFAEKYREILSRDGVQLRLVSTHGAVENLGLLSDPRSDVDVGFVQAGAVDPKQASDLVSLGTLFYEPIWLFCRCGFAELLLKQISDLRLSIGPVGSADRPLALKLLALNGIDSRQQHLYAYSPEEATRALLAGDLDGVVFLARWDSPAVQALARAPQITLIGFPRADAYVKLYPALSKLILPRGFADLATDRPPEDVPLIASKASLVVRKSVQPALRYLLEQAAVEVHSRAGVFEHSGEFPAADEIDLPVSAEARQMYREGPSILERSLPFWLAELTTRLLILLLPIVSIVYPLWTLAPRIYQWLVQRRINRLYGELERLEFELRAATPDSRESFLSRLDTLDRHALDMRLPTAFGAGTYNLKSHINALRQKVLSIAREDPSRSL